MRTTEQSLNETLGFDELRDANIQRQKEIWKTESSWVPRDWALAVLGELGEASNLLKKVNRGEKIATIEIAKELADVATYLDLLANSLNINLGQAVIDKFNEVSIRCKSDLRL